MPTAARLVAALLVAALAFATSEAIKPLMPEGTAFGYFSVANALIGLICGWVVVGKRAGRGWSAAVGNGVTGVVTLVAWALFLHGLYHMWQESLRRRYSDVMEAIEGIIDFIVDNAVVLSDLSILTLLGAGALIVGILTEIAARNWR